MRDNYINGSSALQHFECSNTVKIHHRIMFVSMQDCHIYFCVFLVVYTENKDLKSDKTKGNER